GRSLRGIGSAGDRDFSIHPSIVNRLPSERIDDTVHIGKIVDQNVWMMFSELLATPHAGCDRDCACAEGFPAGDIAWRVADHIDLRCGKFAAMLFQCARASKAPKPVAILMIIGEGAEPEKMPDPEVFEL